MNTDNQELFSLLTSIVKTSRSRQLLNIRILNSPFSILHSLAGKNSRLPFWEEQVLSFGKLATACCLKMEK